MLLISRPFISSAGLYWRSIYHHVFYLFAVMPMMRLLALFEHHHFRSIGKTKIIGDEHFIADCEEFSQHLQKIDPSLFENLFLKSRFVFFQYSDTKCQNAMLGEYAVPARYQKFKAYGVGAFMVYGYFSTSFIGRTLKSYVKQTRKYPRSTIPIEKTRSWLVEHQFPDEICRWFSQNKATSVTRS